MALLLLFAACGGDDDGGTPDATPSPDATLLTDCDQLQTELQQYADAKLTNEAVEFAGLMLGVDTPTCGVVVVAAGLANVEPETPMTPDHMLPIASITKTFVATRVLQLVDEGDLSLDDTLSNWRTDIQNAESITVRQLLNHTSGVPDIFTADCVEASQSNPSLVWTIETILDCIDGLDPENEPGEEWHYSNTNYVLLGSIVEAVTGNALHVEIRSSLLSPLGLDHTFNLHHEDPPGDVAGSYHLIGTSWTDDTDAMGNYSGVYACGDLASNPGDLLQFERALLTGTTLQAATLDEMVNCVDMGSEASITDTFRDGGYGLGIECGHDIDAGDVRGHNGILLNALSQVWYSPSWDSSVVLQINHGMTNNTNGWFYPIASDLFAIVGRSPGFY